MRETLAGPIQNQIHRQRFFYRIQNVVFDHGVEGDIIRYYDYKTDMLQSESRRLNEREALRRKWHCGDDRPMEEHSLTDGRIEGIRREWYPHEKPLRMQEYSGGLLDGKSVAWDAEGHIEQSGTTEKVCLPDGPKPGTTKVRITATFEIDFHKNSSHPYMTEHCVFWQDQTGRTRRTISGLNGRPLYTARKSDCDSTRIDTLSSYSDITGISIGIRDYKEADCVRWSTCAELFGQMDPRRGFRVLPSERRGRNADALLKWGTCPVARL